MFSIQTVDYPAHYDALIDQDREERNQGIWPELKNHVENMADYEIVFLGFPNWRYDMPMPVYRFLEGYDFTGKAIMPLRSYGGGRFGQSLTAIAKLAPDAEIEEGLAISYSGGTEMSDDVFKWLKENGIEAKQ